MNSLELGSRRKIAGALVALTLLATPMSAQADEFTGGNEGDRRPPSSVPRDYDQQAPRIRPVGKTSSTIVTGHGALSPSKAALDDLTTYLESAGNSISKAERDVLAGQEQWSDAVDRILVGTSDTYVEHGLSRGTGASGWISFTERPPDEVVRLLSSLPIDVEMRWGFSSSAIETEAALDVAMATVADEISEDAAISGVPEADRITIELAVPGRRIDETEISMIEEATLAAVAGSTADGIVPVPISIRWAPELLESGEEASEVFGGARLSLASDNTFQCTSGFTAERAGNAGLITARHCPDLLHFGTNTGWIQFVTIASQTPAGNWIDMQFHRAINGTDAIPEFRASSFSSSRTVSSVHSGPPSDNQVACHWGMGSYYKFDDGYECARVHDTRRCFQYPGSGVVYCGIVAVDEYITTGGDSGGPWFYGGDALGIHSGRTDLGPSGAIVSTFTEISMATTYMSTSVLEG